MAEQIGDGTASDLVHHHLSEWAGDKGMMLQGFFIVFDTMDGEGGTSRHYAVPERQAANTTRSLADWGARLTGRMMDLIFDNYLVDSTDEGDD